MSKTIQAAFGEKHKAYIQQASKSIVSVAEGAVLDAGEAVGQGDRGDGRSGEGA